MRGFGVVSEGLFRRSAEDPSRQFVPIPLVFRPKMAACKGYFGRPDLGEFRG